jgi:diguanylate cyclase (GGDEF)-like protein
MGWAAGSGGGELILKRARLAYGVVCLVLVAAYYLWPSLRPFTSGAVAGVSVVAIALGVTHLHPARWGGWLLIAASVVLLGIGDVVFATMADQNPGPVKYPGPPDVFYLAAYLPLALGLLWLGRPRLPSHDWPMLLDTAGLSLSGSLLVWIVLARPAVLSLNLTGPGKVTVIASWVGYVAVLAASARVVLAWRTNLALGLLGAGVLAFLIADFFYGRQLINEGTWSTGSLIDLGFLAFSILCGASALTASMRLVASAGYARQQLGPARMGMVAIGLLVAPTALLVEATSGPVTTGVAIAIVSGAVGVLMLIRLWLSAQAYRTRASREQAVATAAGALVRATTRSEVLAALSDAIRAVVVRPGRTDVRLEQHRRDGPIAENLAPLAVDPAAGELRVPLDGAGGRESSPDRDPDGTVARPQWLAFTAPTADLVELQPILRVVAHQASSALNRINLLADLRAEERERYFRSLVLTSEDVTLISRNGRVSYATPSAQAMFGRDLIGYPLEDIVPMPTPVPAHGAAFESAVRRPDGEALTVRVRRRDLTGDPTVGGIVTTLHDVTAERRLQHDLAYRANHDPLTGLANAQLFTTELETEDSTPDRPRGGTASRAGLFIDMDDFKNVNDTFGHAIGDQLLTEVAHRIQSCLRTSDLAARLGGDEFAVLLRNLTDIDAARSIAQRIADALARPAIIEGIPVDCQASIGLAYAQHPDHIDTLMRQADTALYAAKAYGKGHWRQYEDGMPTPTRRNIDNRRRLQDAITHGQLEMQYQPVVALDTGRPRGFEALIRFPDADPPMTPQEIIGTAEETGLITILGEWIIEQALLDLARLNPPDAPTRRSIAVNLSARQLRRPDFVDNIRQHLATSGADPRLLILEVTESLLVDSDDRAWSFLAELRHYGVRVAIDDYGTGYASLSYLRQPAIDIVKIDKSFLTTLHDQRSRDLLEAVVGLCHKLGLEPVAEGVQDHDSEQFLLSIGCRYGQGFRYAPAMPITEALRWTGASIREERSGGHQGSSA